MGVVVRAVQYRGLLFDVYDVIHSGAIRITVRMHPGGIRLKSG